MGMIFRNMTRHREIGANSYLLESGEARVVLDAGMHPKQTGYDALPDFGPLPNDSAQAILVTHAHHDHIGGVPVLQRRQRDARVVLTEATGEVGAAMLHNSVNVMSHQREEKGVSEYPLFTHRELDDIKCDWIYREYEREFPIPDTDMKASFHDAGHIIGSAGVVVKEGGASLLYTGDVCFEDQTIAQGATLPEQDIDVLVLETTRGTYERLASYTRAAEKARLAEQIRRTFDDNGSVLIPVFALGKTQELLMMMHEMSEEGLIPRLPVIIGGLGTKITVLYDHYCSRVPRQYPGFRLLKDIDILVAPRRRRKEITYQSGAVYLLSSGMMTEGTTSNRFAREFIDNPRNSVAFVGYTDPESPGHRLRTAETGSEVILNPEWNPVEVACGVQGYDFSAHAPREQLAEYAERVKPKKLVLVHGEIPSQEWFAERFRETLPETELILPEPHKPIQLW